MISTPERDAVVRGRMPVASRDRRPALAALALLLILLGALGSTLLVFRSGDRVSVLAARGDISFGHVMTRQDFAEVRAAADTPGVIKAEDLHNFLGTHSLSYLPQGSLLTPKMLSVSPGLPANGEGVGIVVDATRRPSQVPETGQVVRLYYVQGSGGGSAPSDRVIVSAARVLAVGSGSGAGTRSITVLVSNTAAPQVTDYASSNNLAVTVLPDGTQPQVDVDKGAGK